MAFPDAFTVCWGTYFLLVLDTMSWPLWVIVEWLCCCFQQPESLSCWPHATHVLCSSACSIYCDIISRVCHVNALALQSWVSVKVPNWRRHNLTNRATRESSQWRFKCCKTEGSCPTASGGHLHKDKSLKEQIRAGLSVTFGGPFFYSFIHFLKSAMSKIKPLRLFYKRKLKISQLINSHLQENLFNSQHASVYLKDNLSVLQWSTPKMKAVHSISTQNALYLGSSFTLEAPMCGGEGLWISIGST